MLYPATPVAFAATSIVTLLLCGCRTSEKTPPSIVLARESRTSAEIARIFDPLELDDRFHGTVLVAEEQRVIALASFGSDVDDESVYRLASVTKPMTAALVLALVEQGSLSLDKDVRTWIPEFPHVGVTLRGLLSHTSGFEFGSDAVAESWRDLETPPGNEDWLRAVLATRREVEPPGTAWAYSNGGYNVAATLAARATGEELESLFRRYVFEPARMVCSALETQDAELAPARRRVAGHVRDEQGTWRLREENAAFDETDWYGGVIGAKGVQGTALDLLRFVRALRNGALFSDGLVTESFTPTRLSDGSEAQGRDWVEFRFGLGWYLGDEGTAWHTGDWGGHLAYVKLWPANEERGERCVIVLQSHLSFDFSWVGSLESLMD